MADSFTWDRTEQALDRLAADLRSGVSLEPARTRLFGLAATVEAGAGPSSSPLVDRMRVLASTLTGDNAEEVLGAVRALLRERDNPRPADGSSGASLEDDV